MPPTLRRLRRSPSTSDAHPPEAGAAAPSSPERQPDTTASTPAQEATATAAAVPAGKVGKKPAKKSGKKSVEEAAAASSGGSPEPGRHFSGFRHPRLALVRAAHPRQAVLTALALAVAAALAGRPGREVGLVLLTVLVGQVLLGWHNDLVDRDRDRADDAPGKPLAHDQIDPGTVWFAFACGLLLVVPLAVANGVTAGSYYLGSLAIGLLGNLVLRGSVLSWLPWAASFALYPAFLSYGGWGGQATGSPPEPLLVVLAGLLGVGAHFLKALPGLVADNRAGLRHLPLRIALRTGAPRLLWASIAWTVLVLAGLVWAGLTVGLAR